MKVSVIKDVHGINELTVYPHGSRKDCIMIGVNIDARLYKTFNGMEYNTSFFALDIKDVDRLIVELKKFSSVPNELF